MPSAFQTIMQALGLKTSENEFATPAGANVAAQNCMMLAPGLMFSRRGQPRLSATFGSVGDTSNTAAMFGTVPVVQYTHSGDGRLARWTGSVFVNYPSDANPGTYGPRSSDQRMRFLQAAENLYFATSAGVYRLDKTSGTPVLAGMPQPKDFSSAAVNSTADGFLGPGQSVAYRATLCSKDVHGNVIEGPPNGMVTVTNPSASVAAYGTVTLASASGAITVTVNGTTVSTTWASSDAATATVLADEINANGTLTASFVAVASFGTITITCRTAGSAGNATTLAATGANVSVSGATFDHGFGGVSYNVALTFPLGTGPYNTTWFYRIYRSSQSPGGDTAPTTPVAPLDEEFLTIERYITTADLATGSVTVTDTTLDAALLIPLSTNGFTGDGLAQKPQAPPLCRDVTWWDNRAWYWNIQQAQAIELTILGVGAGQDGGTGVRVGDVITIAGWSFTGGSSESTPTFKVFTDGSPASNVERTARSLINVINFNDDPPSYPSSPTIQATYLSVANGPAGQILVFAQDLDGEAFKVAVQSQLSGIAINGLDRISGTVSVTTTAPHNLQNDDYVQIVASDILDSTFEGNFQINVTNATDFTYADARTDGSNTHTMTAQRTVPNAAGAWVPPPPPTYFDVAAGSMVRTTNVTVVTTSDDHGLRGGMSFALEPVDVEDPNFPAGTFTVYFVASPTEFWFQQTAADATSTTAYQSGHRVVSDPSALPHGAIYSKNTLFGVPAVLPEACPPLANVLTVGVAHKQLYRALALDQYQFAFKEEGIYVVQYGSPYSIDLLTDTCHIVAPDTAAVCNGRAFALTNKGVVACTPSGVQIVSGDIEQELFQYFGSDFATVQTQAWGAARETDGLYFLGMPAISGAPAPFNADRIYVYSTRSGTWTTWEKDWRMSVTRPSDDAQFYVAPTTGSLAPTLAQERNTKTAADYVDDDLALYATFGSTSTATVDVLSTTGVEVGDGFTDSHGNSFIVLAKTSTTLTLSGLANVDAPTFATGWVDVSLCSDPTGGVSLNGTSVTVTITGVPLTDAIALAFAIEAALPGRVTASASGGSPGKVNMTAIGAWTGDVANTKTIVAEGAGTTVSGATFTGGVSSVVSASRAIPILLRWRVITNTNPSIAQQFREVHMHFRNSSFRLGTLAVTTDQEPSGGTIEIAPTESRDGTIPSYTADTTLYVGAPVPPTKVRKEFPNLNESAYMNVTWEITEAYAVWTLNGLTLVLVPGSERSQF